VRKKNLKIKTIFKSIFTNRWRYELQEKKKAQENLVCCHLDKKLNSSTFFFFCILSFVNQFFTKTVPVKFDDVKLFAANINSIIHIPKIESQSFNSGLILHICLSSKLKNELPTISLSSGAKPVNNFLNSIDLDL
jgi:hypothetical protein